MAWQFKKIFSVVFAILVGAGVIFFSWKSGSVVQTGTSQTKNNNDWKTALSVVPGINSATRVEKGNVQASDVASDATTTTDIIAHKLLLEYFASQQNTATSTMSDADAQAIASSLAQEMKPSQEKQYALSDLNISSDNSHSANILYINAVNARVKNPLITEQGEDTTTTLTDAISKHDSTLLNKLRAEGASYQKLIKDLLSLKTPSLVAPIHLHLLQSYEMLRVAMTEIQDILTDPAKGIVALTEYRNGVDEFLAIKQEYADFYANY